MHQKTDKSNIYNLRPEHQLLCGPEKSRYIHLAPTLLDMLVPMLVTVIQISNQPLTSAATQSI